MDNAMACEAECLMTRPGSDGSQGPSMVGRVTSVAASEGEWELAQIAHKLSADSPLATRGALCGVRASPRPQTSVACAEFMMSKRKMMHIQLARAQIRIFLLYSTLT